MPDISPGLTLFGVPITPATPNVPSTAASPSPSFFQLPSLPPLDQYLPEGVLSTEDWLKKNPFSVVTGPFKAAGEAFNIITNPSRVITVTIGILIIMAGFYMIGISSIADAIQVVKKVA